MQYALKKPEMHTKVWLENLKGIFALGDVGINERVILKFILSKFCFGMAFPGIKLSHLVHNPVA
jgi:hypothetical protein